MRREEGVGAPRLSPPTPVSGAQRWRGSPQARRWLAPHQRRCLARPLHLTAGRRGVGRVAGSRDSERARVKRVPEKLRAARSKGTARSSAPLLLTYRAEAKPPPPSHLPVSRRGGWEGGRARPGAGPVMGGATPRSGRCVDSAPDSGSQTALSRSRPPPSGAGSADTPDRRHRKPRAARAATRSHSGCGAQSLRPPAGVVLGGG